MAAVSGLVAVVGMCPSITLAINVVAIVVLLLYMQTLTYLADAAAATSATGDGIAALRNPSPVAHAGAALLLLIVATALSVYKPRGMTRYGQRNLHQPRRRSARGRGRWASTQRHDRALSREQRQLDPSIVPVSHSRMDKEAPGAAVLRQHLLRTDPGEGVPGPVGRLAGVDMGTRQGYQQTTIYLP